MKNRAIEADTIGSLRDIRVFIYKPMAADKELTEEETAFYSCLEQAIKVYLNASYGVFGAESFALYCIPVPESVTAYGRRDMTKLIEKAEEIGVIILAGDTDSIFLKDPTEEQMEILQDWATKELSMDLGVDKAYRYVVFSTRKKNYLGIFEDGRPDIKGLTGKKRHIPNIIKRPFLEAIEILGAVKTEEEFAPARDAVHQLITRVYEMVKHQRWDNIEDLAFHMRLGKHPNSYPGNPMHVKAARMLMELGHDIRGGDTVHYIKATNKENVMPVVDANPDLVDVKVYIEQLRSVFNQLIEPLGIDFNSDIMGEMTMDNYPSEKGIVKPSYLVDFLR